MKVFATLATILGVTYADPEARMGSMGMMRSNMASQHQQQQLMQPHMDMMRSNMASQGQQLMQPHMDMTRSKMDMMRSNMATQEQQLMQPHMDMMAERKMSLRKSPMRTMYQDQTMGPKQYFLQDKFGNYAYAYANQNSEKMEQGDQNSVKGHYAYIMSNGQKRRVDYIADNQGFHVIRDDADNARIKRSVEPDFIQTKMTSYMDSSSLRDNSRDMYRMMSPNNMMYKSRMGMMNNQMSQEMGRNRPNDMSSEMINRNIMSQDMSTNMMNRNMMGPDMSNRMMYNNMRNHDMPTSMMYGRNMMDISNNMMNNRMMGQDMMYSNMNTMNQGLNMMTQGMNRMNNDLMGQHRNMMSQRMEIEQMPSNRLF